LTPGDSPKKQAWVWDVLRSYQKDVSILSFMSGDINELGELFQYKVSDFDTFYYQNNSIYLQKEFTYGEITAIVKPLLMRVLMVEWVLAGDAQKIYDNFTTGDFIDLFNE
jgi:acyl-ACP thioesterase